MVVSSSPLYTFLSPLLSLSPMNDFISPLSSETLWSGENWAKEGRESDIRHDSVKSLIRFIKSFLVV